MLLRKLGIFLTLGRWWFTKESIVVPVHNIVDRLESLEFLLHKRAGIGDPLGVYLTKLRDDLLCQICNTDFFWHPIWVNSQDIYDLLLDFLVLVVSEKLKNPFVFLRHNRLGFWLISHLITKLNSLLRCLPPTTKHLALDFTSLIFN